VPGRYALFVALLPALVLSAAAASCGGDDTTSPLPDAASDATVGEDGPLGCPGAEPAAGAPCSTPATVNCVYGPDPYCNPQAWACTPSGWTQVSTPLPPQCPSAPPAAGTPCLQCTASGHACSYDDGGCVATCNAGAWDLAPGCGGADAGADVESDASSDGSADAPGDTGQDAPLDAPPSDGTTGVGAE
jgi:hypothetical protein